MSSSKHYYLLGIRYLGFRYHGWQKQPQVKTIQSVLEKNLAYILGHKKFRTLGASRTDAGVSADLNFIELFTNKPVSRNQILIEVNECLPNDIQVLSYEEIDADFNIIQHPSVKSYEYSFTNSVVKNPFYTPYFVNFTEPLNIDKMRRAASLFMGDHFFGRFCQDPSPETILDRTIISSQVIGKKEHPFLKVNEEYFVFSVTGNGFLRYQVRLMMAALLDVGRGNVSLEELEAALIPQEAVRWSFIAPAHGLCLKKLELLSIEQHLLNN